MRHLAVLLVFGIVCHFTRGRDVIFSKNFQKIGSKYYYIENKEKLDWFDASDRCDRMNAHLVSIKNFKEWDAITDELDCKDYWVDIRHDGDEFVSETTRVKAAYFKWSIGQPNYQNDHDCVKLQAGCFCMKTKSCMQKNYYICEADMRPAPTTKKPNQKYEIIDLDKI